MAVTADYSRPFEIEGPVGNNALSYEKRGAAPKLWVPSAINGTFAEVRPGWNVAFEDFDEHGELRSCAGLRHIVKTDWDGVPTVVVDNHNHVFYFWLEALSRRRLERCATLIHIDQHSDMRAPEHLYLGDTLEDAFRYTNFQLNVGNYLIPAFAAGVFGEFQMVTGEAPLRDLSLVPVRNKILNIDLDFFAPEMSYIDFALARRFIRAHKPSAALITIATSPFFIDQGRAIDVLKEIL